MHPDFEVEGPSGFLKAEVVVQPGVGEVAALHGKVVAPVHQTVRHRDVVRELIGHVGFGTLVADVLPFERELMLPETIVGDRQRVSLGEQVVPEEAGVDVGEPVGSVRQTDLVVHARLLRISRPVLLPVARVDAVVGSPDIEPPREGIAQRDVVAFGLHMSVVLVDAVLRASVFSQTALDVVLRIAVDQAAVDVDVVPAQQNAVAEIEVEIVALLGFQIGLAGFEVFVAEQLVGGGQTIGFLVGELRLQLLQDMVGSGDSVPPRTDPLVEVDVVAHAVGALRYGAFVILVVVFDECRCVPFLRRHQTVGEAADVFARDLRDVEIRQHGGCAHVGSARAAEIAEDVVESQEVHPTDAVVQIQRGIPVRIFRLAVLIGLLAAAVRRIILSVPVVGTGRRVDVAGDVVVVIGRYRQVEALDEEIALLILQRRHERVSLAVFLSEDDLLINARLDLLVEIGIRKAQHQPVGPLLAHEADLAHHDLVVERIVESADALHVVLVHREFVHRSVLPDLELPHPVVDVIVVVRIVLESVDFVHEAALESLPEIDVGAVRIERSVGVGGIGEPAAAVFVRNDIHHASDGVGPELHGNHALVDLDAFGEIDRYVVQVESRTCPLLRHSVNEDFDMFPAESVQHQLHVGTHAARFAKLHARQLRKRVAQVLGRILQLPGVQSHGIERRSADAAHAAARYDDLLHFRNRRLQDDRAAVGGGVERDLCPTTTSVWLGSKPTAETISS